MKARKMLQIATFSILFAVVLPVCAEESAEVATEVQTEAQTQAATESPATEAPATEAQTQAATESPQTEAQTQAATEVQTETQMQAATEKQTESVTEVETEAVSDTQVLSESGAESETETQASQSDNTVSESETDLSGEPQETTETPSEILSESESETETETESEEEERKSKKSKDTEEEHEEKELEGKSSSQYSSNSELIAAQNIVNAKTYSSEYRFTQIDKVYATTLVESGITVYESKSEDSSAVGSLGCQSVCFIIKDSGDGWYYIESGAVRGFVKSENIIVGDEALLYVNDDSNTAEVTVPYYENKAFTYTLTTVYDVIADKVYAISGSGSNIYESEDVSSSVVGTLGVCGLCYILEDDGDWVFVESGKARGFVQKEDLISGSVAKNKVESIGEDEFSQADVLIDPEDNDACYYTLTSVDAADQSSILREQVVEYALQFVGNPYVWGGTSLTNGADCSGFVQSIYGHFGYSLPRVAASQAVCSTQIPVSQASPGDLIFFAEDGYVYHVAMYIGNGQIVHAANSKSGIITSGIWSDAVWAVQIIH